MSAVYQSVRRILREFRYLLRTFAPPAVIVAYAREQMNKSRGLEPHLNAQSEFRAFANSLQLSNDWFTARIPYWLSALAVTEVATDEITRVLEIGSWEGLSAVFLLHALPRAIVTCVDTWEGADEHQTGDHASQEVLSQIEMRFDHNVAQYADRVIKFKGTSYSYFDGDPKRSEFDIVYIDGSHHCDDVIVDAFKGFEALKVGGLLIFDDYLWRYYETPKENPAAAINTFLRLKKGSFRIVRVYYQLIIQKTHDRYVANGAAAVNRH